jgi:hypothetical protein
MSKYFVKNIEVFIDYDVDKVFFFVNISKSKIFRVCIDELILFLNVLKDLIPLLVKGVIPGDLPGLSENNLYRGQIYKLRITLIHYPIFIM